MLTKFSWGNLQHRAYC